MHGVASATVGRNKEWEGVREERETRYLYAISVDGSEEHRRRRTTNRGTGGEESHRTDGRGGGKQGRGLGYPLCATASRGEMESIVDVGLDR